LSRFETSQFPLVKGSVSSVPCVTSDRLRQGNGLTRSYHLTAPGLPGDRGKQTDKGIRRGDGAVGTDRGRNPLFHIGAPGKHPVAPLAVISHVSISEFVDEGRIGDRHDPCSPNPRH